MVRVPNYYIGIRTFFIGTPTKNTGAPTKNVGAPTYVPRRTCKNDSNSYLKGTNSYVLAKN